MFDQLFKKRPIWQSILIAFGVTAGVFLLLNLGFIRQQVSYHIAKDAYFGTVSEEDIAEIDLYELFNEPNTLYIPSIGVEAPIIYSEQRLEWQVQDNLTKGVVHHPDTAPVGQLGNTFIFGHSSDFLRVSSEYRHIFANLDKVQIDEEIYATDADGSLYTYIVVDTFVAEKDDLELLDQYDYEMSFMTLQTSWPLGTALKRYIVLAELID